MENESFMH